VPSSGSQQVRTVEAPRGSARSGTYMWVAMTSGHGVGSAAAAVTPVNVRPTAPSRAGVPCPGAATADHRGVRREHRDSLCCPAARASSCTTVHDPIIRTRLALKPLHQIRARKPGSPARHVAAGLLELGTALPQRGAVRRIAGLPRACAARNRPAAEQHVGAHPDRDAGRGPVLAAGTCAANWFAKRKCPLLPYRKAGQNDGRAAGVPNTPAP